ncbi:MAG TPA: DNA alkylation repair protein [Thermoanaerobaculia bacterium]|nr:DNA alkylation repair protein [Thermoanaerobaculia bacterium]
MAVRPVDALIARIRATADPKRAEGSLWFFKTAPGQYGHGDQFLGLTVPQMREIARDGDALTLRDLAKLLDSPWHEERLIALLSLVRRHEKRAEERDAIYELYLSKTDRINNWDLVDASAPQIVGPHATRATLTKLARSQSLWERRIAIIATQYLIRRNEFAETLRIARILLHDEHDLIHKAVGWMLREVGKRDQEVEETFLREHAHTMPRTMLRYAIERFPEELRKSYLAARSLATGRTALPPPRARRAAVPPRTTRRR